MGLRTFQTFGTAAAIVVAAIGCDRGGSTTAPAGGGATTTTVKTKEPDALKDEIPADKLAAVLKAHQEGVGLMEQYRYPEATKAFRRVRELAPGWIPGSINLAIARLNDTGVEIEAAKKAGGGPAAGKFDEALRLLDEVLKRDPTNPHAHYCRGLIYEVDGRTQEAHREFQAVVDRDPNDGYSWYKLGSTLPSRENPTTQHGPAEAKELIAIYTRSLECNPYLASAYYKLAFAYAWDGKRDKQKELLAMYNRLNPRQTVTASGELLTDNYGEQGRYARVIDLRPKDAAGQAAVAAPRFDVPAGVKTTLPAGMRWSRLADFTGRNAVVGRARSRFGAPVVMFDANGDGKIDMFLPGGIAGAEGPRDALLINTGDGAFEEASAAWKVPTDRVSVGAAAGDFDADGRIDLALTGVGGVRVLRNVKNAFEDATPKGADGTLALTARWLDLDQDGDLDLYVVNYGPADAAEKAFTDAPGPGAKNGAFRNDGIPAALPGRPAEALAPLATAPEDNPAKAGLSIALTPWDDGAAAALLGAAERHTAVAALDIEGDRDIDLVLTSEGGSPAVVLNDRLGRFRGVPFTDLAPKNGAPVDGLLVGDFDKDGRPDLAALPKQGRVALWRGRVAAAKGEEKVAPAFAFEFWATDAHDWRWATLADLDLDGAWDLIGLPSGNDAAAPEWARNEGNRLATRAMTLGPEGSGAIVGMGYGDVAGDALPEVVLVRDGEGPRVARNLGNGRHWLAISFAGRWRTGNDHGPMRSNPEGIGVAVALQGPTFTVPYVHTTTSASLDQSLVPVVFGLGDSPGVPLVRLTWPDGVLQCELNMDADRLVTLNETCRKTGSCPVLFTWNGERFVCLGDFLGGGGLGYLVAPGVTGDPDRDEAMAITSEQLRPENGRYRISITEPMDEVAYIDHVRLEVVDRPPGVKVTPDERFAPGGNRPTGALLAWREEIAPARAADEKGRDVTETLRLWDRATVDGFARRKHWVGYAEEHGITLDFGDRLARFGPSDRLVLCLAGWVEYPYSQTNYAAATAGEPLRPPVLERLQEDGSWKVIESDPGYPAGLPRMTTLELTGRLGGPRCVLRLRTNMECYYDRAFVAVLDPTAEMRVTSVGVSRAVLGARGYTREVSPDGRQPLIYDYNYVDPAPLAKLRGELTRYGDVAELLTGDDDRLCLVGPGDEIQADFDASGVPPLPEGWTRSYVLRSYGYCKDADPFTVSSDTVGPLPWKGMGRYPFGPEGERPKDAGYSEYLKRYQTRRVGG